MALKTSDLELSRFLQDQEKLTGDQKVRCPVCRGTYVRMDSVEYHTAMEFERCTLEQSILFDDGMGGVAVAAPRQIWPTPRAHDLLPPRPVRGSYLDLECICEQGHAFVCRFGNHKGELFFGVIRRPEDEDLVDGFADYFEAERQDHEERPL